MQPVHLLGVALVVDTQRDIVASGQLGDHAPGGLPSAWPSGAGSRRTTSLDFRHDRESVLWACCSCAWVGRGDGQR